MSKVYDHLLPQRVHVSFLFYRRRLGVFYPRRICRLSLPFLYFGLMAGPSPAIGKDISRFYKKPAHDSGITL